MAGSIIRQLTVHVNARTISDAKNLSEIQIWSFTNISENLNQLHVNEK